MIARCQFQMKGVVGKRFHVEWRKNSKLAFHVVNERENLLILFPSQVVKWYSSAVMKVRLALQCAGHAEAGWLFLHRLATLMAAWKCPTSNRSTLERTFAKPSVIQPRLRVLESPSISKSILVSIFPSLLASFYLDYSGCALRVRITNQSKLLNKWPLRFCTLTISSWCWIDTLR